MSILSRDTCTTEYSCKGTNTLQKEKLRNYECKFGSCGSLFTESNHLMIHTGDRPFLCTYENCHKSFLTSGNFKSHLNYHSGNNLKKCFHPGCTKSYLHLGKLKAHLRTHIGLKPYSCNFENCQKSFNDKWNLKSHLRSHYGKKGFKCYIDDCNLAFVHSHELRKHLNTHSNSRSKFFCPKCPVNFTRYTTILVHIKMHEVEQAKQHLKVYFTCKRDLNSNKKVELIQKFANTKSTTDTLSSLRNLLSCKRTLEMNTLKENFLEFEALTMLGLINKPNTEKYHISLFSQNDKVYDQYSRAFDPLFDLFN